MEKVGEKVSVCFFLRGDWCKLITGEGKENTLMFPIPNLGDRLRIKFIHLVVVLFRVFVTVFNVDVQLLSSNQFQLYLWF